MRRFFFLIPAFVAFSQPQQPLVVSGEASFHLQSPDLLEIVAADKTIIEWNQFHIEPQETTRFLQPSGTSSVLNRVLDASPSRLMGCLESNGQLVLINPNGILVGKEAQINTGSLIATTLDLQNQEYLDGGSLAFKGSSSASLIIEGKVQSAGGALALISGQISQRGSLHGPQVYLLAGSEVQWGSAPKVKGNALETQELALVFQEGTIEASRLEIQTATGSDRLSIYHTGSIATKDSVLLFAKGGTNWVNGSISCMENGIGGSVKILGERVGLGDGASIEASGMHGGGLILIGGDYQGLNREEVAAAKNLYVSPQARISAAALQTGDGGRVILWGDESNHCYGKILAGGGPLGGDGGFVEISSLGYLDYQGEVSTFAPIGKTGTLLLDPSQITIGLGAAPQAMTGICGFPATTFALNAATGNLSVATLTGAGGLGANNITVTTSNGTCGPFAGTGDILVVSAVNWATQFSLTLNAARNITITASVQNTGAVGAAGDVILIAPTGSTITIGGTAGNFGVGSQNGRTFIGDPNAARCNRTRPNLFVGLTTGVGEVNLGFSALGAATATGLIDVTCGNLTVQANQNSNSFSSAAIGHFMNTGFNALTTTTAATITVDASGDVHVLAGNGFSDAIIGHGGRELGNPSDLQGDIAVSAGGEILIQNPAAVNTGGCTAMIGHGPGSASAGNNTAHILADITVHAKGNIILENDASAASASAQVAIGHYNYTDSTPGGRSGNIYVFTESNLFLTSAPGVGIVYIAHNTLNRNTLVSTTSNTFISAKNNINLTGYGTGFMQVGTTSTNLTNGLLEIIAGGNLCVNSGSGGINALVIGYTPSIANATCDTNIAVGGNITLFPCQAVGGAGSCCAAPCALCNCPATCPALGQAIQVTSFHDLNVSALGNIDGTGTGFITLANFRLSFLSTSAFAAATRVNAGGYIRAHPGTTPVSPPFAANTTNYFLIGISTPSPILNPTTTNFTLPATTGTLIVQAGQDLQMLNGYRTTTGTIAIGSGISFGPGELWTIANNQLATIGVQYPPTCPPRNLFAARQLAFSCAASCLLNGPATPCVCTTACTAGNPCPGLCRTTTIPIACSVANANTCTCLNMNSSVNFNSAALQSQGTAALQAGPIYILSNTCVTCAGCTAVGSPNLLVGLPTNATKPASANTIAINPTVTPTHPGDIFISQFPGIVLNENLTAANLIFNVCKDIALNNTTTGSALPRQL